MIGIAILTVVLVAFFTIGKRDIENAEKSTKEMEKSLPPEVILANAHLGCMAGILKIILWILVGIAILFLAVAIGIEFFGIDKL